jgi:DedD protein
MMRQRLVGALVLLCLGVIVWSLLFTGSVDRRVDRQSQIPEAPQINPVLEQEPHEPEGVVSIEDSQIAPQPTLPPTDIDGGEGVRAAAEPPVPQSPSEPSEPKQPIAKLPEKPAVAKSVKSTLDERGLPEAWVVQVGSFGSRANAEALVTKLRSRGYKSFFDTLDRGGRNLYRVQVGPVLAESKARSLKIEIDRGFQVKSIVNRFEG